MTIQTFGLEKLSRQDRLSLVQALWDSLEVETSGSFLTQSQQQELDRRAVEDDQSPEDTIPWTEVRNAAKARRSS